MPSLLNRRPAVSIIRRRVASLCSGLYLAMAWISFRWLASSRSITIILLRPYFNQGREHRKT